MVLHPKEASIGCVLALFSPFFLLSDSVTPPLRADDELLELEPVKPEPKKKKSRREKQ